MSPLRVRSLVGDGVVHRLCFRDLVLRKVELDELISDSRRPVDPDLLADEFDLAQQDGLARFLGKPWLSAQVAEDLVRVGG